MLMNKHYISYRKLHILEFTCEDYVILDTQLLQSILENFYCTIYNSKSNKYNKYACSIEILYCDRSPAMLNFLIKYGNRKSVESELFYFLNNFKEYTSGGPELNIVRLSFKKL
jgi:hypothetical protein